MNSPRATAVSVRSPLRPDYYLENFRTALDWLSNRYGGLLSAEESQFIAAFDALSRASQSLLVRLLMRRGDCFRCAQLRYEEIGSIAAAAEPLIALGWIDACPRLAADELFRLLKVDELRRVFPELRAGTKKELHARVLAGQYEPQTLERWTGDAFDSAYRVVVARLCTRLRVLFFGSFHQQWSTFVVADLGIYKYEQVEFTKTSRVLHSRADIECFYRLHQAHELCASGTSVDEVLAVIPDDALPHAWLEALRGQLLFDLARRSEQAGDRDVAIDLYQRAAHPDSKVRALRIRERCGDHGLAYTELQSALAAAGNARERELLHRIRVRLERRVNGVRSARAKPANKPIEIKLDCSGEGCSIEERVRRHIDAPLAPAFYVENALINSLVGLLCWEAVFAPVPGAFFHPFHVGPVDLASPDFCMRRVELFELVLRRLNDGSYVDFIRAMYVAKRGTASPFVYWGALTESLLSLALTCIPAAHLKAYCDWVFEDVTENTAGFPDLMQFYPQEQRYRMIEVKGPGDRLQDNQKRWLERCRAHGLPIDVIHVQWIGEAIPPRKRRRPRQLEAFAPAD